MKYRIITLAMAMVLLGCSAPQKPAGTSDEAPVMSSGNSVNPIDFMETLKESGESRPEETPDAEPEETGTDTASASEQAETDPVGEYIIDPSEVKDEGKQVIWAHEPDLGFEGIWDLRAHVYSGIPDTTFNEEVGYAQQFDDITGEYDPDAVIYGDPGMFYGAFKYTPDAVAVSSRGKTGVYDYDGRAVADPYFDGIGYSPVYGFCGSVEGRNGIILSDFRNFLPAEFDIGLGGDPGLGYAVFNGKLVHGFTLEECEPVDSEKDVIQDARGHNCLVQIVEEKDDGWWKNIGWACYSGKVEHQFDIYNKQPLNFINGFISFSDDRIYENSRWMPVGKVGFFSMNGKQITDYIYDDAKWFEEGYCPVMKDGHWGFIDENGNEVTDMIFDEVSTVYDGKAYVGIQGTYGVIDLKNTLNKSIPVTLDTCYPKGLKAARPVPAGKKPDVIPGAVFIRVEKLNARSEPSTKAEKVETVECRRIYPVYEFAEADGYTWYRIGENRWIADKNYKWVVYMANK